MFWSFVFLDELDNVDHGYFCRIPAVGFPALVPGHHVPFHSAHNAPVNSGKSSTGKRGKEKSKSKRGKK